MTTTEIDGARGYGAGKKINPRMRHIVTDTLGRLAGIADMCGFSSQAHFTRWFKRIVGVTLGVYRMHRK